MGVPVSWFEINTHNSVALRAFYGDIFGWDLQPYPGETPYALVDTGVDGAIRGGLGDTDGANRVVIYLEVDDPQAYLDRIEQAGGRTIVPVTEIPDAVTFAHFADPEGNVIGLSKAAPG
jgi:predicted enzyme related to lactoylglutathione lyase